MTQPVTKRADQIVVGDRILNAYLPAYARSGDADVLYVEVYHYFAADWVFVAFASRDGDRNSTSYPPDGTIKVHSRPPVGHGYSPADTGRPDFVDGPCEDPDCPNASWPHFASSDLADPDPTGLGYSPADDGGVTQPIAVSAPPIAGCHHECASLGVSPDCGVHECDEGEYLVSHGPVKPPYGTPEREAYDREHGAR